jgi:hypothetical protein
MCCSCIFDKITKIKEKGERVEERMEEKMEREGGERG